VFLRQTPILTLPPVVHSVRLAPPVRDPHTPGYVAARELSDGSNAPADADGNFIIGPTHNRSPRNDGADQSAARNGV